ncbi:MAG: hypothetical protein WCJ56_03915 [bacterium]
MKVLCPSCKREIPPEDINIQSAIAKCSACGEFFMVGDNEPEIAVEEATTLEPVPKGFTVNRERDALIIKYRDHIFTVIFMTCFVFVIDVFVVLGMFFKEAMNCEVSGMLSIPIFPVIGVLLHYMTLALLMNSTEWRISAGSISIHIGPVPWPGSTILTTKNIQRVFCEKKAHSDGEGHWSNTYELFVLYNNGTRTRLIMLGEPEQARFIEQQLAAELGLPDTPVIGEMDVK